MIFLFHCKIYVRLQNSHCVVQMNFFCISQAWKICLFFTMTKFNIYIGIKIHCMLSWLKTRIISIPIRKPNFPIVKSAERFCLLRIKTGTEDFISGHGNFYHHFCSLGKLREFISCKKRKDSPLMLRLRYLMSLLERINIMMIWMHSPSP